MRTSKLYSIKLDILTHFVVVWRQAGATPAMVQRNLRSALSSNGIDAMDVHTECNSHKSHNPLATAGGQCTCVYISSSMFHSAHPSMLARFLHKSYSDRGAKCQTVIAIVMHPMHGMGTWVSVAHAQHKIDWRQT